MGKITSCALLGRDQIDEIVHFIHDQLESGQNDIYTIADNFWNAITSGGKIQFQDAIIYMASFFKVFPRLIAQYRTSGDQTRVNLLQGLDFNLVIDLYDKLDVFASNQENPVETIEKISEFIKNRFIDPFIGPDTVDDDTVIPSAEVIISDTQEEIENEEGVQDGSDPKTKTDAEPEYDDQFADDSITDKIFEDNDFLSNSEQGIKTLLQKIQRQGYVAMERLGKISAFRFNAATNRFIEISPDLEKNDIDGHEISMEDFMDKFIGSRFLVIPAYAEHGRQVKESSNDGLRTYYAEVIKRFEGVSKLITFYGNAIKKASRELPLFTFKEGKLVPGELAGIHKFKNAIFKKIYNKLNDPRLKLDVILNATTLNTWFGSDKHRLFMEINDDKSLNKKQVILIVKKLNASGKYDDVMVLGNIFDLDEGNRVIFKDVQNGPEYLKFLESKIAALEANPDSSLDVTDMNLKVEHIFQPAQKRHEANKIYANDKHRHGKEADIRESQKLKLTDGIRLLEGMGFGVSEPMIDKSIVGTNRPGGAFIAVSPFLTGNQINIILRDAFKKGEKDSAKSFEALNKKHQISFIYLERKKLKLSDYTTLLANNSTVNKMINSVGDSVSDFTKRQSLFSTGQSPLIHFRLAKSIEYLEAVLAKNPENELLKKNIMLLKIFLFNNQDFYSVDKTKRKELEAFKKVFNKFYHPKEPHVIPDNFIVTAEKNYQAWKALAGQRDGSSRNRQLQKSKEFASKLYGYYPATSSTDPFDIELREKKEKFAALESKDDPKRFNEFRNAGGIFSNAVIFALKDIARHKDTVLNGMSLEQQFDNESEFVGDLEISDAISGMSYNPLVENSDKEQGFIGDEASSLRGLKSDPDGSNIVTDYLELPYLPLMPHLQINAGPLAAEGSNSGKNINSNGLNRSSREVPKTVESESFIDEKDYQLTEQEAESLYESILGGLKEKLQLMDSPIEVKDGLIIGLVGKQVLKLLRVGGKISERVLRHEIMHRIVNEVLTPEAVRKLYNEAKNRILKNDPSLGSVENITDTMADEYLADHYMMNHSNYSSSFARNLPKIIKDFYFVIREIYLQMSGRFSHIDLVMEKAEAGVYQNASLAHNNYIGGVAPKKILFNSRNLAAKFNKDLSLGSRMMDMAVRNIINNVQYTLYGNQIAVGFLKQDRNDPSAYDYGKRISYREAIEKARAILVFDLSLILEKDESIKDSIDELSAQERALFFDEEHEFYELKDLVNRKDLSGVDYNSLSENGKFVYQTLISLHEFNALAKLAVPFVDLNSVEEANEKAIDEASTEADENGDDKNNMKADKLRSAFERSEISAYGTFTEKVKFFLYNTKQYGSKFLVNRKHVDNYFHEVVKQVLENSTGEGGFDLNLFLNYAKEELDKLDPNKNGGKYELSEAFRSVKGIYDRFFSEDASNEWSFLRISMIDKEGFEAQAAAHTEVLAAIISAQKSVVQQNFMKIDRDTISETRSSASKDVKNGIKDALVFRLFVSKRTGSRTTYKLSKYALKTFFNGGKYKLSGNQEGLVVSYGERNSITITSGDIVSKSSMFDFTSNFLETVLSLFPNDSDLFNALNDLGISMTRDYFDSIVAMDSSRNSNRKRLAEIMVHGHIILHRQYIKETGSQDISGEGLSILEKMSDRRHENIHKILNQNLKKDLISAKLEANEDPDSLDETSEKNAYSPSMLHMKIERAVGASALTKYERKDTQVFITDGSKETVDKYPNTMHRVIARLSNFGAKLEQMFGKDFDKGLIPVGPGGEMMSIREFIAKKYPGVYSFVYKNPVYEGLMDFKEVIYFKGSKNLKTNRSRNFLESTETEFLFDVVKMLVGEGFANAYYHPLEIQADRGFLAVLRLLGVKGRSSRFFARKDGKGNFTLDNKSTQSELQSIYNIPFHHALNSMKEAANIIGMKSILQKVNRLEFRFKSEGSSDLLLAETFNLYREYEAELQVMQETFKQENKSFNLVLDRLTDRKHFVKVDGKVMANPLLIERMSGSYADFQKDLESKYLEFAEYFYDNMSSNDVPAEGKFYLTKEHFKADENGLDDETFIRNGGVRWFNDSVYDRDKYNKQSAQQKINGYHPALYSMFLTYFINQKHISQATSGDMYLYKGDEITGLDKEHSYVSDYIKRQATSTTPRIEGTYRQEVTINGVTRIFNKNAIGEKITVGYYEDTVHDAVKDSPTFSQSYIAANGIKPNKDGSYDPIKTKSTDGHIATNILFQHKLKATYGGNTGMNIDTELKFGHHTLDPVTGDLHISKGLAQVITGEFLQIATPRIRGMVRAMYSTASFQDESGKVVNLWDFYEKLLLEHANEPEVADSILIQTYFHARNNERGLRLIGDIVDYLGAASANKGAIKGLNRFDSDGNRAMDEVQFSAIGTEGFGIILDLQKDINKEKNEVSLSTQMMFLMGINGTNFEKAFTLYNSVAKMSSVELDKISTEIAKLFDKAKEGVGRSILENKAAVRKWMVNEIKNAFISKNDFGLIYKLVENIDTAAVSNPILFEEIFQKVGSRFNKVIKMKMNGFKSVHAPAHDFIKLYLVDRINGKGEQVQKWVTRKDAIGMGLDPETLVSRNSKYSFNDGSQLTDTEIFTGNIFVGKYGIDPRVTIDQVFTVTVNGVDLNIEAENHLDTQIPGSERFNVIREAVQSNGRVEWLLSPIVQAMIKDGRVNTELSDKMKAGIALTPAENQYLLREFELMANLMNSQLYGVITRIPGTGKNSSSPFKIAGFVNGYKNGSFLPSEWFLISGADNDGDTVQLWHYGSENETEEYALSTVRSILKDKANENEIFAAISLEYFKDLSAEKKKQMLASSHGFVHGSIKTMVEVKSNNAVGAEQTGVFATLAKVHSYSIIAKSFLMKIQGKFLETARSNSKVNNIFNSQANIWTATALDPESQTLIKAQVNSGPLSINPEGNNMDASGSFLYRWNEMLTNGAIDNPKFLYMDATGINRYNSNIQQAMTFYGFNKDFIISFLTGTNSKRVFKKMSRKDNIASDSMPRLDRVIAGTTFSNGKTGIDLMREITGDPKTKTLTPTNALTYFESTQFHIDMDNPKDIIALMVWMESKSEEINMLRKIITATDDVAGKSATQEISIENIMEAVNLGFSDEGSVSEGEIKAGKGFKTPKDLKNFLEANSPFVLTNLLSNSKSHWEKNPLVLDKIVEAQKKAEFIHPLVVIMTVPHIREFVIGHLSFNETKDSHLIEEPRFKGLRKEVFKMIERKQKRLERNRTKVTKSIYKYIHAEFLRSQVGIVHYSFLGKSYNFGSPRDIVEFRSDLANYILAEKATTSNQFIKRLEVGIGSISFPSSDKMDEIMKQIPSAEFDKLDHELQDALFNFELTSSDTQLQYKKGSYVTFMNLRSFDEYNAWMRGQEHDQTILTKSEQGLRFLTAFAYENPSLLMRVWEIETDAYDPNGNGGYLSDSATRKSRSSYDMKAKKIKEYSIGYFSEEAISQGEEINKKIASLETEKKTFRNLLLSIAANPTGFTGGASMQAQMEIKQIDIKIAELKNELNFVLLKNLGEDNGSSMFRVIKGYDDKAKAGITRLYKVRKMTEEESKKANKTDAKVYGTVMEEVFIPFDADISLYLLNTMIPEIKEEGKIFDSFELLQKAHNEKVLSPGTYYTKDFQKVEVIEGSNPEVKQFSFRDTKATPEARKKAMAFVAFIKRVFPNIKLEFVSGLDGVYGKAAGFVHNGTVYLNLDNIGMDTPIHEFGHIFIDLIQQSNPELYAKIEALIVKLPLFDRVSKKYAVYGNKRNDNIKEAFVTLLGQYFENNNMEILSSLYENEISQFEQLMKEFVNEFRKLFNSMLSFMNIRKQYINQKLIDNLNMTSDLDSIFQAIAGAVIEGEVITDLTTKEFNELNQKFDKQKKVSDSQVQKKILELMEKGLITNYC